MGWYGDRKLYMDELRKYPLVIVMLVLWMAFTVFTTIRDNFLPTATQAKLAIYPVLTYVPWYWAAIVLLSLLLVVVFEASYHAYRIKNLGTPSPAAPSAPTYNTIISPTFQNKVSAS